MAGLRSKALICAIGKVNEGRIDVLRPVPAPSSVIVIGELFIDLERTVKAWVRRFGTR